MILRGWCRHSDGAEQFAAVTGAVRSSLEFVQLGEGRAGTGAVYEARDDGGRDPHGGSRRDAGGEARTRRAGRVGAGATLSGIAAESLEAGSAIQSRTIASLEHAWGQGQEGLTPRDVLVIDEAGMVGSRQMERVLSAAGKAGAKVVLVGDPEQLQAIEAGAAFRALAERHGAAEITEVRRQRQEWQRAATKELATGGTDQALGRYAEAGMGRPTRHGRRRGKPLWRAGTRGGARRRARVRSCWPTRASTSAN